jgi:hypothetical protein
MSYDLKKGCAMMRAVLKDYTNIRTSINNFIEGSKDDLQIFEDSINELIDQYQRDDRVGWSRPLQLIAGLVKYNDFEKALKITDKTIDEIKNGYLSRMSCPHDVPGGKRKSKRRKSNRRKSKRSRKSRRRNRTLHN